MEIVWLSSADKAFLELLKHVEEAFGTLVAEQVSERIYSHIDLLALFPYIGVRDSRFLSIEIRYLVNTPNIIYYTVFRDKVILLSILNSRQSPDRIYQILAKILETNQSLFMSSNLQ